MATPTARDIIIHQILGEVTEVTEVIISEWQDSVFDKDLTAPPGGESEGDRFLIGTDTTASVATGEWAGHDGEIGEFKLGVYVFTLPTTGMVVSVDDEANVFYQFGGTTWVAKNVAPSIIDSGTAINQLTRWDGTKWVPSPNLAFNDLGSELKISGAGDPVFIRNSNGSLHMGSVSGGNAIILSPNTINPSIQLIGSGIKTIAGLSDPTSNQQAATKKYVDDEITKTGISLSPVASAQTEIISTTKGFLGPRMTSVQRDAITSPASGLEIYDTTNNAKNLFNGTAWKAVVSTAASSLAVGSIPFAVAGAEIDDDNANLFWNNTNKRLGIGTNNPSERLHISGGHILIDNTKALKWKANDGSIHKVLNVESTDDLTLGSSSFDDVIIKSGFGEAMRIKDITGNVGIGTPTPDATALVDLTSTTKGFLKSRLTSVQRDAIVSPATGLEIYDKSNNVPNFFNATAWKSVLFTDAATLTAGSILFSAGGAEIDDDNANLSWDNVAKRLNTKDLAVTGDVNIVGNLTVTGISTTVESETVNYSDNHLYLNAGYTAIAAQTGGLVTNYLPTATTDSVSAGTFTAGVASTSNPTVSTVGIAIFSVSDIIQITGTNNNENDGIFEILSHAANLLTIRGIGITGALEDFTGNQFIANAADNATITKVNISVLRTGTDGVWETASGSVTGFSFKNFAILDADVVFTKLNVDNIRIDGNTISSTNINGNINLSPNNAIGDVIVNGNFEVRSASNQIRLIETDNADKTWHTEVNGGNYNIVETGVVTPVIFNAGTPANAIVTDNLSVTIGLQLNVDNIRLDGNTLSTTSGDFSIITSNGGVFKYTSKSLQAGLDSVEYVEIGHDGTTGFIDAVGDAGLEIRLDGIKRAALTDSGNFIVENQIQIKGGIPGSGKVLTSDIAGLATWQTASAGGWVDAGATITLATGTDFVGIGALPLNPLHIQSDTDVQLRVEPLSLSGQDAILEVIGHRNATIAADQANLIIGNFDDDLGTTNFMGSLSARVTNDTTNIGDMIFYTYADGQAQTETMRLTSTNELTLAKSTSGIVANLGNAVLRNRGTNDFTIQNNTFTADAVGFGQNIGGKITIGANSNAIDFSTGINAADLRMQILDNGDITIGGNIKSNFVGGTVTTDSSQKPSANTSTAIQFDRDLSIQGISFLPNTNQTTFVMAFTGSLDASANFHFERTSTGGLNINYWMWFEKDNAGDSVFVRIGYVRHKPLATQEHDVSVITLKNIAVNSGDQIRVMQRTDGALGDGVGLLQGAPPFTSPAEIVGCALSLELRK